MVHNNSKGDVDHDGCGAVQALVFLPSPALWLVLISFAEAGGPQTASVGSLVLCLKQSHAPFFPPEKAIVPPSKSDVGDAVTFEVDAPL